MGGRLTLTLFWCMGLPAVVSVMLRHRGLRPEAGEEGCVAGEEGDGLWEVGGYVH